MSSEQYTSAARISQHYAQVQHALDDVELLLIQGTSKASRPPAPADDDYNGRVNSPQKQPRYTTIRGRHQAGPIHAVHVDHAQVDAMLPSPSAAVSKAHLCRSTSA
jgi:hypothetical protein